MSLKPSCRVFDFRDHASSEFKKLYKVIDEELVKWIVERSSASFDMSDVYEFVVALQEQVLKPVDMSGGDYLKYSKLFGASTEPIMTPKLFSRAYAFCKSKGLVGTWEDFSVH